MNQSVYQSPRITISLLPVSTFITQSTCCPARACALSRSTHSPAFRRQQQSQRDQGCSNKTSLTITTNLWPPLATPWLIYISGRSEYMLPFLSSKSLIARSELRMMVGFVPNMREYTGLHEISRSGPFRVVILLCLLPIFLCPFLELKVSIFGWHLQWISTYDASCPMPNPLDEGYQVPAW